MPEHATKYQERARGTVHELFEAHRRDLGLSQKELAQAIGMACSTVNAYLKGDKQPSVFVLSRLCRVLKIETGELFRPGQEPPERHHWTRRRPRPS
jgi:transcriptional regulator with XRE-family HTH domain